ncbi:MAG: hypothetical protein HY904_01315 [Deltaproteobacteria bacterium]|nr:hypothetical protein [Deltaproteobacteria bacterium]
MKSVTIVGVFDSAEVASAAAKALNSWFAWVMEASGDEMPPVFEDFGLDGEEWAWDRDSDTDWEETPMARAKGTSIRIQAWTNETTDMLQGLLESMGAYEVEEEEEVEEED